MSIALWGPRSDPTLAAVRAALVELRAPYVLIDQADVMATEVALTVGEAVAGHVAVRDMQLDLAAVSAIYVRAYDSRRLPSIIKQGSASAAWRHAGSVDEALSAWAEVSPARVVNRPFSEASNGSKPYQIRLIREVGFQVPNTLVTTDAGAARDFWKEHGTVIYKSISAVRSQVTQLNPAHGERLSDVLWCPTQFQRRIAGLEHRVHVVGDEVFACEVHTDADDYRYSSAEHPPQLVRCELPQDISDRCREVARRLGLLLAGLDLRRTAEGEWFCFEANPAPAFTFYEQAGARPIARAVARLLAGT